MSRESVDLIFLFYSHNFRHPRWHRNLCANPASSVNCNRRPFICHATALPSTPVPAVPAPTARTQTNSCWRTAVERRAPRAANIRHLHVHHILVITKCRPYLLRDVLHPPAPPHRPTSNTSSSECRRPRRRRVGTACQCSRRVRRVERRPSPPTGCVRGCWCRDGRPPNNSSSCRRYRCTRTAGR